MPDKPFPLFLIKENAMIQRQQTLWLLLATVAAVFTFMFDFAIGHELLKNTSMTPDKEIIAGSNFFTLLLTIASIGVSFVTIFMFKDRKLQMRLCLLGLVISIIIIVIYFLEMKKLVSAKLLLSALLPVAVIAGYFMAFKNIRKDEKLVKSLDKLR
jgi:Ca2+/Na+ antiporter